MIVRFDKRLIDVWSQKVKPSKHIFVAEILLHTRLAHPLNPDERNNAAHKQIEMRPRYSTSDSLLRNVRDHNIE